MFYHGFVAVNNDKCHDTKSDTELNSSLLVNGNAQELNSVDEDDVLAELDKELPSDSIGSDGSNNEEIEKLRAEINR